MKSMKRLWLLAVLPLLFLSACGEGEPAGYDTGMLFDDPVENTFNYCPSVLQTDENTRYIYYCANILPGVIQDHIICRKGTREKDGKWSWTEKKVVLAPTPGKYDGLHCCDPSVIQGKFRYGGTEYAYLMAYTGNTDQINNKVGLAVSNNLMEDWVKVEGAFRTYGGDPKHWGVGQPSLVSADKKGEVMLFYSVGSTTTYTQVERLDLSDLDNPVTLSSVQLTQRGLVDLNGNAGDVMSNGDYAYDPVKNRYYAVSDCHPNPTDSDPMFVGSHFRVTYLNEKAGAEPGSIFGTQEASAGKSWSTLATVGPNETGFPRNSNCGIVTDPYGWTLSQDEMEVFYSISKTGANFTWSYRIYPYLIPIQE